MVALTHTNQTTKSTGRLTLQTVEIAPETTAIRCLDWDRDRFDIEFGLQNGTTYNFYLRLQNPNSLYLRCLWDALLR